MEKPFTVTSEDKKDRTMDRSGSVTENASHPTKSSRGRNKKQKSRQFWRQERYKDSTLGESRTDMWLQFSYFFNVAYMK
jgi:hypothetical protein